jgi:DNA polymerase III epsilon subunit-like protein
MPLPGFVILNGNVLAAVDVETTGRTPGWHEVIQIGIQPLNSRCEPLEDTSPFYFNIRPEHPERAEAKATQVHKLDLDYLMTHAPTKWQVADWLDSWWSNLGLPHRKTLVPLAQNWAYEAGFLKAWLGLESFNQFFYWEARDTMLTAIFLKDYAYLRGRPIPFEGVGLAALCNKFGIINEDPHNALADARAEAAVYKCLLEMEL